ncbi:UNKNOWN [Stylonychia lemnae]|uniref:Uncharacterized protein n=1 Tax=Stylonychia lemnae TaxID=5949 RepID=A0A078AFT9_STYLE|nr:UNKNOWN [Stylonychia lemnae]|eukprot:CDW79758.1 UNKNOWN [Stylonychia lemnae]
MTPDKNKLQSLKDKVINSFMQTQQSLNQNQQNSNHISFIQRDRNNPKQQSLLGLPPKHPMQKQRQGNTQFKTNIQSALSPASRLSTLKNNDQDESPYYLLDSNAQNSPMRSPKNEFENSFVKVMDKNDFQDKSPLQENNYQEQFQGFKTKTMFNEYYKSSIQKQRGRQAELQRVSMGSSKFSQADQNSIQRFPNELYSSNNTIQFSRGNENFNFNQNNLHSPMPDMGGSNPHENRSERSNLNQSQNNNNDRQEQVTFRSRGRLQINSPHLHNGSQFENLSQRDHEQQSSEYDIKEIEDDNSHYLSDQRVSRFQQ